MAGATRLRRGGLAVAFSLALLLPASSVAGQDTGPAEVKEPPGQTCKPNCRTFGWDNGVGLPQALDIAPLEPCKPNC